MERLFKSRNLNFTSRSYNTGRPSIFTNLILEALSRCGNFLEEFFKLIFVVFNSNCCLRSIIKILIAFTYNDFHSIWSFCAHTIKFFCYITKELNIFNISSITNIELISFISIYIFNTKNIDSIRNLRISRSIRNFYSIKVIKFIIYIRFICPSSFLNKTRIFSIEF